VPFALSLSKGCISLLNMRHNQKEKQSFDKLRTNGSGFYARVPIVLFAIRPTSTSIPGWFAPS
jgi:hypothetical protein